MNLYRYCGNKPISTTDPTGLFWGCADDCNKGDEPTEGEITSMEILAIPLTPDRKQAIQDLFVGVQGLEAINLIGTIVKGNALILSGVANIDSLVANASELLLGVLSPSAANLRGVIEDMQDTLRDQNGYRVFLKVTWKECESCSCLWGEPGYEYNEHSCWQISERKHGDGLTDDRFGGRTGNPHFTMEDLEHSKKLALGADGCRAKAIAKAK